jgi:hypothetical protein
LLTTAADALPAVPFFALIVIYNIPSEAAEFPVPTPTVGHIIIRALRNMQRTGRYGGQVHERQQ